MESSSSSFGGGQEITLECLFDGQSPTDPGVVLSQFFLAKPDHWTPTAKKWHQCVMWAFKEHQTPYDPLSFVVVQKIEGVDGAPKWVLQPVGKWERELWDVRQEDNLSVCTVKYQLALAGPWAESLAPGRCLTANCVRFACPEKGIIDVWCKQ
jgi:hypothetical protein